jgi:GNAT superfamily N-acetyltransferase
MFRTATPEDTSALVALGDSTGVFAPREAETLLGGVLDEFHAGRLGEGHRVELWAESDAGPPGGWVYFAPTANASGVWDLWWIGVAPALQGRGVGSELLRFVETQVLDSGGRLLIVETSSRPRFDRTRRFYLRHGYAECGHVPDFYAEGDGKVTFAKRMEIRADRGERPGQLGRLNPEPSENMGAIDAGGRSAWPPT